MAKKKGGTLFGNLLAKAANLATGGILGAKRVAALNSGNVSSINANETLVGKTLKAVADQKVAAGIHDADTDAAGLTKGFGVDKQGTDENPINLKPVVINFTKPQAQASAKNPEDTVVGGMLGQWLSFMGKKTTENATVGADKTTLMVIGGGLAAIIAAILISNNNKPAYR